RALVPRPSVREGWISSGSGRVPFSLLTQPAVAALPPLRRALVGTWRSGKLPGDVASVNESIHDSVMERFGQRVTELSYGRPRPMTYRPRNLAAAISAMHTAGTPDRRRRNKAPRMTN